MGFLENETRPVTNKERLSFFKRFTEVLDKHNIRYWLVFGTLLGCVRDKGFMPWDSDIDICIDNPDEAYTFKDEFLKNDIIATWREAGQNNKHHYKILNLFDKRLPDKIIHADIYEFRKFKGHYSFKWTVSKPIFKNFYAKFFVAENSIFTDAKENASLLHKIVYSLPEDIRLKSIEIFDTIRLYITTKPRIIVFPETKLKFKKVDFYDMKVLIPATWKDHLELNYGSFWYLPDKKHVSGQSQKIKKIIKRCEIVATEETIL